MPRLKTQRLWLCLWRPTRRGVVAAANRRFARPHRPARSNLADHHYRLPHQFSLATLAFLKVKHEELNRCRFQNNAKQVRKIIARVGDAFHYRWAARRCLRLIDPQSPLQCITIESSKESKTAGEYAIDLAEYSATNARDKRTDYYQLKHSTVRTNKHVVFSEICPTIRAFAKRFAANLSRGTKSLSDSVAFWFVTNRCVNAQLKRGIKAIGNGLRATPQLQQQLEAVTRLQGTQLRAFCKSFSIVDGTVTTLFRSKDSMANSLSIWQVSSTAMKSPS